MVILSKAKIIIPVLVILLLSSCSASKTSQCNKLKNVVGQLDDAVTSIPSDMPDSQTAERIADKLDSLVQKMESLQLDDQLDFYRDSLVSSYRDSARAVRGLGSSADSSSGFSPLSSMMESQAFGLNQMQAGLTMQGVNSHCESN